MKGIIARSLGLAVSLAALSTTLLAGPAARQPEKPQSATPLPTDWSHQHLIFSHPRTPEQAARVEKDIRYQLQQRRMTAHRTTEVPIGDEKIFGSEFQRHHAHRRGRRMHRDWSTDLGPGATAGPIGFPAKYSFSSTVATCGVATPIPDFITYATGLAGSSSQGTIVAFTNLYVGCGGPVPASFWSYNTGGQILTSPVLSYDGTQVAFTQTNGALAVLVLLRWSAFDGQVNSPATDLQVAASPAAYPSCTAPCMTTFALGANDTISSVYYDYGADTAWVGDDSGSLHQYTGVFKGTPTEVIGGGWPASVSGASLTSAVHDDGSGNTFVSDNAGFLYRVDSTGAATSSAQLDAGTGFTEGPIIDSSAGSVYVFSSSDGAGSAGIFQLSTSFALGDTGSEATVGTATAGTTPQFNGAFDHNYITAATPTGNLYVCADPGGLPTIYQISIVNGVMGTPKAGPVLSATTETPCSPVTDVYNPLLSGGGLPEEWVFASVRANGTPAQCGGVSCVMNFRVSSWQPNTVYNAGQLVLDSNLNIQVADNSGGTSGANPPVWGTAIFAPPTADGTVHWRNQGPLSGPTPPMWAPNTFYDGAFEIVDSNNNIEIESIIGGGFSGATTPTWPMAEGATTVDGFITWYNLGANPVAGLSASGGTSGIVIDNTIDTPGGSQIYYSTLQDDACEFGATGGCAVQASQQGLN